MKTKLISTISVALLLTACSSHLTDVNHKWCPPEQKPIVKQIRAEQINLAADTLFKFGKHNQADLLEKGQIALSELVQKINSNYAHIDSINLTGHTDRLGSKKANYKLGLNRAKTIKSYLQQHGVTAPISVTSIGEEQPVTKDCKGNKATKALIECLQPDRRVVVEIQGIKKED